MKIKFYGKEFEFQVTNKDDLGFDGKLVLDGSGQAKFEELCKKEEELEEQDGPWYLDENGERLSPDKLFLASPWSICSAEGDIKIISRFQNHKTGEIKFQTQQGYPGELFGWVRGQNA